MAANSSSGEMQDENMQNQNEGSETEHLQAAQRDGDWSTSGRYANAAI
jgi:hypothetical protein